MEIISSFGNPEIATVYCAQTNEGNKIECVQSLQPPLSISEKWVLIISTMVGCPVGCLMCDAGGFYKTNLSASEMLDQIEYMVQQRFPDRHILTDKWKIQFARMGEPAFNRDIIDVLGALPEKYVYKKLIPSISTVAPANCEHFFNDLFHVSRQYQGDFQLQFSIHSTDADQRDRIIPVKKWTFEQIAEYGKKFYEGGRKITLNFALAKDSIVSAAELEKSFDSKRFLIKITPINPTHRAKASQWSSGIHVKSESLPGHPLLLQELREAGFDVILSIGEIEENQIGSNCGQYIQKHMVVSRGEIDGYSYVNADFTTV